jgi:hypothetical protein
MLDTIKPYLGSVVLCVVVIALVFRVASLRKIVTGS